jgi:hypothetical protein
MADREYQALGHTMRLTARPAWRWGHVFEAGYYEPTHRTLSGGMVLTVEGPQPVWGHAYSRYTRTTRLRPDWTERQFLAATNRLIQWAGAEAQRQTAVAVVWHLEQQSIISDALRDAIMAEEKRLGRDSSYDTMSVADSEFWSGWLNDWLLQHPEDRKDNRAA